LNLEILLQFVAEKLRVLPVGERCDDQTRLVAQVFVGVFELGVADVGEAVLLLVVPAMTQLALPQEFAGAFSLV